VTSVARARRYIYRAAKKINPHSYNSTILACEVAVHYHLQDVPAWIIDECQRALMIYWHMAPGGFPKPTTKEPSVELLKEWEWHGGCEATDGCWVERDGRCQHEHVSWLRYLCLV
jgi:hypothetical protein